MFSSPGVAAYGQLNYPLPFFHVPMNQSKVVFGYITRFELFCQNSVGFVAFCNHHEAGCVFVQSVNNPGAQFTPYS